MECCHAGWWERTGIVVRRLSDRHERILCELRYDEPTTATVIARRLGLTRPGAESTLYALQSRGLCERVPWKGWIRR